MCDGDGEGEELPPTVNYYPKASADHDPSMAVTSLDLCRRPQEKQICDGFLKVVNGQTLTLGDDLTDTRIAGAGYVTDFVGKVSGIRFPGVDRFVALIAVDGNGGPGGKLRVHIYAKKGSDLIYLDAPMDAACHGEEHPDEPYKAFYRRNCRPTRAILQQATLVGNSLIELFAIGATTATTASAQECPQANPTGPDIPSNTRQLDGDLIYHDGLRKWFELKLAQPQCGQSSVQLLAGDELDDPAALAILRGCRVSSTGPIEFSKTGYFSLDTYQEVSAIKGEQSCKRQAPFPDYSDARPDDSIQQYRVDMSLKYVPGDDPIRFRITSSGKELHPWQAYANYDLTGLFVLYGSCGHGFVVDRVFGTPQASPSHFELARTEADRAAFDPERAAASGKTDLHLSYTCVRGD
jgi:hypothetical protein